MSSVALRHRVLVGGLTRLACDPKADWVARPREACPVPQAEPAPALPQVFVTLAHASRRGSPSETGRYLYAWPTLR